MRYRDFGVRVRETAAGALHVEVLDSPAGCAFGETRSLCEIDAFLKAYAELALGRPNVPTGGPRSSASRRTPPPPTAERLGTLLFKLLFPEAVKSRFDESLGAARKDGGGLRLRIHHPAAGTRGRLLAALPWELLYRAQDRRFFALHRETPIVRFLEVSHPFEPLPLPYPLRIGIVGSSPVDSSPLDLDRELEAVAGAWNRLRGVAVTRFEPSYSGLRRAVIDERCHVFHFMGHGGPSSARREGGLALESPGGSRSWMPASRLRRLLQGSDQLRLVVLNACYTSALSVDPTVDPFGETAQALVLGGIPAVVAMALPIRSRSAREFGARLYECLARGEPLDAAVTEGRLVLDSVGKAPAEWAVPTVLSRVPDMTLFQAPVSADIEGEARRAFDDGLARYHDRDYRGAREAFFEASRLHRDYGEAELYACLARLAVQPPSSLDRSDAQQLNERLCRLIASEQAEVQVLASRALGLLRHDYFELKRVRAEGIPSSQELFRRLAALRITERQIAVLEPIRHTPRAGLAVGLPPRPRHRTQADTTSNRVGGRRR